MAHCTRFEFEINFNCSTKCLFKPFILLNLKKYFPKMKNLLSIFAFFLVLTITSCQTRVVSIQKPLQKNSLELYQKYSIQTNDAKIVKMEVLRQDDEKIYGKTKSGEEITVNKSDVREVKKLDLLSSIAIGVAAIAAVIFVPI